MRQPYEIFKAFADETRLRILSLVSHQAMSVGELTRILELGQSKVSRHLDYLKKNSLVKAVRIANQNIYSLDLDSDTFEHQILKIWKVWSEKTLTGQNDWNRFNRE